MFPRVVTIAPSEGARSRQVLPSSTATPFLQLSVVRREREKERAEDCAVPRRVYILSPFLSPFLSVFSLSRAFSYPIIFSSRSSVLRAPSIARCFLTVCFALYRTGQMNDRMIANVFKSAKISSLILLFVSPPKDLICFHTLICPQRVFASRFKRGKKSPRKASI